MTGSDSGRRHALRVGLRRRVVVRRVQRQHPGLRVQGDRRSDSGDDRVAAAGRQPTQFGGGLNARIKTTGGWAARWEYGPTTEYGLWRYGGSTSSAGGGWTRLETSLRDVAPGRTYHYRLVVNTPAGVVYSPDATFTTLPYGPPQFPPSVWSHQPLGNAGTGVAFAATVDGSGVPDALVVRVGRDPGVRSHHPAARAVRGRRAHALGERARHRPRAGPAVLLPRGRRERGRARRGPRQRRVHLRGPEHARPGPDLVAVPLAGPEPVAVAVAVAPSPDPSPSPDPDPSPSPSPDPSPSSDPAALSATAPLSPPSFSPVSPRATNPPAPRSAPRVSRVQAPHRRRRPQTRTRIVIERRAGEPLDRRGLHHRVPSTVRRAVKPALDPVTVGHRQASGPGALGGPERSTIVVSVSPAPWRSRSVRRSMSSSAVSRHATRS